MADVVVQIQLRAEGDDPLDLSHQIVKLKPLGLGDVLKRHPPVDALDNEYLVGGFGRSRLDDKVLRPRDVVLIDIPADQIEELLAVLPRLSLSDTLAVVQFLVGDRIEDRHVLQRRIPEDDPRL